MDQLSIFSGLLVTCLGVTIEEQLTFADHVRRIIGRCFHSVRQLPSIRTLTNDDWHCNCPDQRSVVISRIDYCNAVLTGVYGVHIRQLQRVLNAAACLIVRKRKFDSISSMIRDVLRWLPIQLRLHGVALVYLSTISPCANKSPRISTDTVYVRLHVEIWLFLS